MSRSGTSLSWRHGGWVIAAALVLGALMAATILVRYGRAVSSDPAAGRRSENNGFDLTTCLVPRDALVRGMARDAAPAIVAPRHIGASAVAELAADRRTRYLVSSDRVVSVSVGDETRAYPLLVLAWHEVVNDTVGGEPIAVTYNPLCDSVVVFSRRVGAEVIELGVSGLLLNSNLLLYDRLEGGAGESLWSQLQARAVAGPAAEQGLTLDVLPATLTRWDRWRARHPDSLVLDRDPSFLKRYKRRPYDSYFGSDILRFPVAPLPPEDGPGPKSRVVVVEADGRRGVWLVDALLERADAAGRWDTTLGGASLLFETHAGTETVAVTRTDGGALASVTYAFWFAWHAHHPETELRN